MKTKTCLLAFLFVITCSALFAQESLVPPRQETTGLTLSLPQTTGTIDDWQEPPKEDSGRLITGERIPVNPKPIILSPHYYSNSLRAYFKAEYMYIMILGQRHEFWGARIYGFSREPSQPGSPLQQLGLQPGDIITRLDGFPIWEGMRLNGNGIVEIPELERHVGVTDVRYIRRQDKFVSTGKIVINNAYAPQQGEVLLP